MTNWLVHCAERHAHIRMVKRFRWNRWHFKSINDRLLCLDTPTHGGMEMIQIHANTNCTNTVLLRDSPTPGDIEIIKLFRLSNRQVEWCGIRGDLESPWWTNTHTHIKKVRQVRYVGSSILEDFTHSCSTSSTQIFSKHLKCTLAKRYSHTHKALSTPSVNLIAFRSSYSYHSSKYRW